MTSYEEEYGSFAWRIPANFNFAFDVIDRRAREGDKLALVSVDDSMAAERHSFGDLTVLSNKMANALKKHGLRRGDRIIIMLPSVPEWYVAVLGAIKLGVIFIPTPTLSSARDIAYRIKQSGAAAAITNTDFAGRFEEAVPSCPALRALFVVGEERSGWVSYQREMASAPADFKIIEKTKSIDPLLIYFTSGTTGYPKMVLHSQAYALAHVVTARYVQDLWPEDLHWTIADTGWAKTAWGRLFGQWLQGATIFQHNSQGRFDAEKTLRLLEKYEVTTFCAPPTAYRMLVMERLKVFHLSVRHCVSAGEPLSAETMRAWKTGTGLDIYDCYGQTETVCLVANYPCLPIKPGSMGKPTPGHRVAVVDDDGHELPARKQGKIAVSVRPVRPPGLLREYWNDPEATANAFRGDWYYTGDVAFIDEGGYFWFVGRDDDVIKSSGYRIGPFEVESALQEHPAVAESAVIGVPDPVRGQAVKAFVVLKPGHEGNEALTLELQDLVKRVTAPYKYPRQVEYIKELPKTISGKILRGELRRRQGT